MRARHSGKIQSSACTTLQYRLSGAICRKPISWFTIALTSDALRTTRTRRSRDAYPAAISDVLSVLALSTTTYSKRSYVCARTLSMHSARVSSPLYTGVTTETRGLLLNGVPTQGSQGRSRLDDVFPRLAVDPARIHDEGRVPTDERVIDGRVVGHDEDR